MATNGQSQLRQSDHTVTKCSQGSGESPVEKMRPDSGRAPAILNGSPVLIAPTKILRGPNAEATATTVFLKATKPIASGRPRKKPPSSPTNVVITVETACDVAEDVVCRRPYRSSSNSYQKLTSEQLGLAIMSTVTNESLHRSPEDKHMNTNHVPSNQSPTTKPTVVSSSPNTKLGLIHHASWSTSHPVTTKPPLGAAVGGDRAATTALSASEKPFSVRVSADHVSAPSAMFIEVNSENTVTSHVMVEVVSEPDAAAELLMEVDSESDTASQLLAEEASHSDATCQTSERLQSGAPCRLDECELLQLVERSADGERQLETVSEVSLVDIRAVCEVCGCAISHHMVGLLARHDGSEYGYRCRICQSVFTGVHDMAAHMDSHRPLADAQCRFCTRGLRAFGASSPLRASLVCHACDTEFESRAELIRHRQVHPLRLRFPCELCDRAFAMRVQLEVHMRSHLGHKPYSCDLCPSSFVQPSHLINHRRTHTGERPFRCDQCGRAFVQQGHLMAHARTHTGERPYQCDVCSRRFTQSGQLAAHKKLHEGDAPFRPRRQLGDPPLDLSCRHCRKHFKQLKDLRRHQLVHNEGTFECQQCGRAFKRSDHLKRHTRLHERPSSADSERHWTRPAGTGLRRPKSTVAGRADSGAVQRGLKLLDTTIDSVLSHERVSAAGHQASRGATLVKLERDHLQWEADGREDDDGVEDGWLLAVEDDLVGCDAARTDSGTEATPAAEGTGRGRVSTGESSDTEVASPVHRPPVRSRGRHVEPLGAAPRISKRNTAGNLAALVGVRLTRPADWAH